MQAKPVIPTNPINILKVATCPSLSGRSQLTYQIGKSPEGVVHLRITQNSGSGQFNADWVSLEAIETLVSVSPPEKPLTSSALHPAFTSKSSNSPAFLFAALKAESLVTPYENKDKGYLLGDFSAFRQATASLLVQEGTAHPLEEVLGRCEHRSPRHGQKA